MKDYLSDEKLRRNPYSVPDGYFEKLPDRMFSAVRENSLKEAQRPRGIRRFAPYASLAAAMLVLLSVGSLLIKRTLIQEDSANLDNLTAYFDITSLSETDATYYSYDCEKDLTDEDIIDYLIQIGASAETVHELTQE